MVIAKIGVMGEPHHPQRRSDCSLAGYQQGADDQNLGPLPDPLAEYWREGLQHRYHLVRQGQHLSTFRDGTVESKPTLPHMFCLPNG